MRRLSEKPGYGPERLTCTVAVAAAAPAAPESDTATTIATKSGLRPLLLTSERLLPVVTASMGPG